MMFYVYTLAYPDGGVFYVGKGKVREGRYKQKRERIDTHEGEARRGCHCSKCEVIRSIWATSCQFKKTRVYETAPQRVVYRRSELDALAEPKPKP